MDVCLVGNTVLSKAGRIELLLQVLGSLREHVRCLSSPNTGEQLSLLQESGRRSSSVL